MIYLIVKRQKKKQDARRERREEKHKDVAKLNQQESVAK